MSGFLFFNNLYNHHHEEINMPEKKLVLPDLAPDNTSHGGPATHAARRPAYFVKMPESFINIHPGDKDLVDPNIWRPDQNGQ